MMRRILSTRLLMLLGALLCVSASLNAQDEGYDPPILELTEDACEVEITPEMVDMLLYAPRTFYTLVIPDPCEPPPTQYKCKGCRGKNATVYECFHLNYYSSRQIDPASIIRQMEQADRQLMATGYTLVLRCERPNGFYPDMKVCYRVRATCNDKITAIVDDQMGYTGAPNYKRLKEDEERFSPIKYREGEPIHFLREVEALYYEDAAKKLYVQGLACEGVQVYPDGKIVVDCPRSPDDDRIGIFLERSRNMGVSATWFDYSVLALGRKVSSMLGAGIVAQAMSDGRVRLVAKHKTWDEGEWHLVVDPQHAYLVVEVKLVDKRTNEIVEQWWSTDSIGDKLTFARQAVWFKPGSRDYLVVECAEYRLCFDDDFARQVLQRIKRQRSFRDMRVEPFLDIRVHSYR